MLLAVECQTEQGKLWLIFIRFHVIIVIGHVRNCILKIAHLLITNTKKQNKYKPKKNTTEIKIMKINN